MFSQHLACRQCGRSFERLTPNHFSFNSGLGWCPSCEGLGTQTAQFQPHCYGPEAYATRSAVALWPDVKQPLFAAMLEALSRQLNLPADVPFDALSTRQRRTIMYGAEGEWIEVYERAKGGGKSRRGGPRRAGG